MAAGRKERGMVESGETEEEKEGNEEGGVGGGPPELQTGETVGSAPHHQDH